VQAAEGLTIPPEVVTVQVLKAVKAVGKVMTSLELVSNLCFGKRENVMEVVDWTTEFAGTIETNVRDPALGVNVIPDWTELTK
jgi:hypothetical protein